MLKKEIMLCDFSIPQNKNGSRGGWEERDNPLKICQSTGSVMPPISFFSRFLWLISLFCGSIYIFGLFVLVLRKMPLVF